MFEQLMEAVRREYRIPVDEIRPIREMIGSVHLVLSGTDRFVLKLFRAGREAQALRSAEIMAWLNAAGVPAVEIVPSADGRLTCDVETQAGSRLCALYRYVEGEDPDKEARIGDIAGLAGRVHGAMQRYPGDVERHGKPFFIDRYVDILRSLGHPRASEFARLGDVLWDRVEALPAGFCHGDFHTGNMIEDDGGTIWLLDFDAAAIASPLYDVATICDGTDYFDSSEHRLREGFDSTKRLLDSFASAYGRQLRAAEETAVFDFIAIRHYDIQATILECLGWDCVDQAFLENQFRWLARWHDLCRKMLL